MTTPTKPWNPPMLRLCGAVMLAVGLSLLLISAVSFYNRFHGGPNLGWGAVSFISSATALCVSGVMLLRLAARGTKR